MYLIQCILLIRNLISLLHTLEESLAKHCGHITWVAFSADVVKEMTELMELWEVKALLQYGIKGLMRGIGDQEPLQ